MSFYSLNKSERVQKYKDIEDEILNGLINADDLIILKIFNDDDTYVRRAGYLAVRNLWKNEKLRSLIIKSLERLIENDSEKVRQTVINSCGEITVFDFKIAEDIFKTGILDKNHTVKNAVIGSLKKSGQKNPRQIIEFCKEHILDSDPEIRRQMAHGLELRGRTHPEDIMPVLKLLQFEKTARVRNIVIHIFSQISYKKGCLEKVVLELKTWENKELVKACFEAIIKQHYHINRHFKTATLKASETLSGKECENYIKTVLGV